MSHVLRLAAASLICAALGGCANPDRVVFVTVTGVGLGYDAGTQTGHLGYDRQEFYAAPDYPKLKGLPPVAASLQSGLNWFAPSVSQYYATGDAALIATGRKTLPPVTQPPNTSSGTSSGTSTADKTSGTATTGKTSGADADLTSCALNEGCDWTDATDRRLSIIATNTHLGLVVKGTAGAMTSLDFGYGRQEASLIPLRTDGGKDYFPSAFASITVDTSKNDTIPDGLAVTQFFATGGAADALAAKPGVTGSFDIMAKAASAAKINGVKTSLDLTPDQQTAVDAQVKTALTATDSDSSKVLQLVLQKDENSGPLTDQDWTNLATAARGLSGVPASDLNQLVSSRKFEDGTALVSARQLKFWMDMHKDARDALIKAHAG